MIYGWDYGVEEEWVCEFYFVYDLYVGSQFEGYSQYPVKLYVAKWH